MFLITIALFQYRIFSASCGARGLFYRVLIISTLLTCLRIHIRIVIACVEPPPLLRKNQIFSEGKGWLYTGYYGDSKMV